MDHLLIDIGGCCEHHTNETLDFMMKAIGDGTPEDIWDEHPSPLISQIIELFTQRGLSRLEHVRKAILDWQSDKHFDHKERRRERPGRIPIWTEAERELVRIYLSSLPSAEWTLDDHMLCIDLVMQTYMPADDMMTEAQWLVGRSALMGKVQANMDEISKKDAAKVLTSFADEPPLPATLGQRVSAMVKLASVRCAENVTRLADNVRHRMRWVIMENYERKMLGDQSGRSLEGQLLDEFGTLNRDWRRIAITEAGEALNVGLIASLPDGSMVKRVEQYAGACAFCRSIDGRIMEVVQADAEQKDEEHQIWLGKTNVGRSGSPRKRVGGTLVERTPDEMWRVPVGLAHPNCRGRYVRYDDGSREGDDPEFAAKLREILG